ncbi:uncharacterized protein LOC124272652 isoform X2 [Haliotis rubra]|uniref:uncharacterized protein LOC124272652 isoform X2 n=1 Tax=Haliotis rubra TaxID=36100 RepID=UPI001EE62EAF|nr:uncharacterized protein LOC124272652 isoform X2 [Haliotis rubra]
MTRAAIITRWLFTIGLISVGISHVYGLTLTAKDETGTIGPHRVTVKCDYVVDPGETLFSITMSRKIATDPGFTDITVFRPCASSSLYDPCVTQNFRDRTTLILSNGSTSVRFDRVKCGDEAPYKCIDAYQTVAAEAASEEADMNLLLLAPATQKDSRLSSGARGCWSCCELYRFRYRDNTPVDITSLPRLNPPYQVQELASLNRISQVTLNVSRLDNGMTIQCAANHSTLTKAYGIRETCNSWAKSCRQTDTITVFFATTTFPPTTKTTSTQTPSPGSNDAVKPEAPDTLSDTDAVVSSNLAGGTHLNYT